MKSILLKSTLLACTGLAFCGLSVQAQIATPVPTAPAAATPAAGKAAAAKKIEYQGTLKAIDAGGTSVTVTVKDADMTLKIDTATKILVDKKKAQLSDFAVGDKVTGSYTKDDAGATTAASLHKKTAAPKAK